MDFSIFSTKVCEKYICIMWSNAISVRTSAMKSSRQPKIRVLKFHGGPCL